MRRWRSSQKRRRWKALAVVPVAMRVAVKNHLRNHNQENHRKDLRKNQHQKKGEAPAHRLMPRWRMQPKWEMESGSKLSSPVQKPQRNLLLRSMRGFARNQDGPNSKKRCSSRRARRRRELNNSTKNSRRNRLSRRRSSILTWNSLWQCQVTEIQPVRRSSSGGHHKDQAKGLE